jgi:hypothetical protein
MKRTRPFGSTAALPLGIGLVLAVALTLAGPSAAPAIAADPAPSATAQQSWTSGVEAKACQRLFAAFQRLIQGVAARASASDDIEITITRLEMDDRHRVYVDIEGDVELRFGKIVDKLWKKLEDIRGHQMSTNGPFSVDFTVTDVERTDDASVHVEYRASLYIVLEEMLARMVKFAFSVAGTLTVMSMAGDLAGMLEGINPAAAGEGLAVGKRQLTKVLAGLAGVEAYDAYRGFRRDREELATQESAVGSVAAHLILAIAQGCLKVGTKLVGITLGAAVGAALFPATGAALGAIIGAAAVSIVGKVVFRKLTTDLPVKWRTVRIRKMLERRATTTDSRFSGWLSYKIERQEIKLLKRVCLEMRTDKFTYLDEILEQIRAMSPDRKKLFAGLRAKLEPKLAFQAVNRGDRLFARKLDQLRAAFGGDAPPPPPPPAPPAP